MVVVLWFEPVWWPQGQDVLSLLMESLKENGRAFVYELNLRRKWVMEQDNIQSNQEKVNVLQ